MQDELNEKETPKQKSRIGLILGIITAVFVFLLILLFPKKQVIVEYDKKSSDFDDLRNDLKNELNDLKSNIADKNRKILKFEKANKELNEKSKRRSKSNKSEITGKPDDKEGTGTPKEIGDDESDEDD